ncbi:hypothetical protein TNCV_4504231 [Trichonephila clavipes]|nr:hypothetical protein TNCV_4504231 [Trichonephila clavipes]
MLLQIVLNPTTRKIKDQIISQTTDSDVTLTLENFFANPPTTPLVPTNTDEPTERLLTVCYRPITVPAFTCQFTANFHWFPPQTFTSSPLLRPATTSSSTSLQPANQVASCFPSWYYHFTRQHSLFMLWDGGTLRVPCPNKSYTVIRRAVLN